MNAIKYGILIFSILVVIASCTSARQLAGDRYALVGKTRYMEKALPAGEVLAMRAEPGGALYGTDVSPDGTFVIAMPAGPYLLMGKSRDPDTGKELFAYWNNNPVRLHGNVSDPVVLPFVESTGPPRKVEGGGISGIVLFEGRPLEEAVVAVFLSGSGDFHGLPYAESAPSDEKGRFSLNVAPGRYFVLARWRASGGTFQGPLLRGDLAGFYPHNPVILREGEGLVVDIPMTEINRPRGQGSLAHGEAIVVEGTVRTVTGQPAAGVRTVLYDIPEMLGRPAFISSPSDAQGRYRLEVSREGRFFAAARSVIGRPPETGEFMGFFDGTEDHSIVLEMGDRVQGIDIVVREVW